MSTNTMQELEPIVARWRTSGRVVDEDGAEVATVDGTDAYEWMPGRRWVIHHVDVEMGGERTRAIEVIGEPSATGSYTMRAFDASGAYDEMTLTVDGRTFRTDGDGMRNILTVAEDGESMGAVWERRADDGAWRRWMEIGFERL